MGFLNFFRLEVFIQHFDCQTFIETGTGEGIGLRHARNFYFQDIYSIEIMPQQVEKLKPEFAHDPRVHILAGESIDVLAKILPEVKTNAVFWLDAHFPGADLKMAAYDAEQNLDIRLPLERELRFIRDTRKGFRDVFLIDDLRVYEQDNFEFGNLSGEELRLAKFDSRFLYSTFQETHDVHRFLNQHGYIALTPKMPPQQPAAG